jgi:hypothetical protein
MSQLANSLPGGMMTGQQGSIMSGGMSGGSGGGYEPFEQFGSGFSFGAPYP